MTPPLISSNPDIMGGAWCISGTRIPAKAIQSFHEHGYDCDRIREEYPGLCNDQIFAAIEFKEPKSMTTQQPPDKLCVIEDRDGTEYGHAYDRPPICAEDVEYALASTADEHKRQRDRLLAVVEHVQTGVIYDGNRDIFEIDEESAKALETAIAECNGETK